jgi:hypothetical protein
MAGRCNTIHCDLPTFVFTFRSSLDFIGALGSHNRNGRWEFRSYIAGSVFLDCLSAEIMALGGIFTYQWLCSQF